MTAITFGAIRVDVISSAQMNPSLKCEGCHTVGYLEGHYATGLMQGREAALSMYEIAHFAWNR